MPCFITPSICIASIVPCLHLILSDWLLDARHSGRHAVDETRAAHGHLLLGLRQLRDIVAMGKGGRSGSGGVVTVPVSLPAYASKYGVLHLAAAGRQAETLLDAGEGRGS